MSDTGSTNSGHALRIRVKSVGRYYTYALQLQRKILGVNFWSYARSTDDLSFLLPHMPKGVHMSMRNSRVVFRKFDGFDYDDATFMECQSILESYGGKPVSE